MGEHVLCGVCVCMRACVCVCVCVCVTRLSHDVNLRLPVNEVILLLKHIQPLVRQSLQLFTVTCITRMQTVPLEFQVQVIRHLPGLLAVGKSAWAFSSK